MYSQLSAVVSGSGFGLSSVGGFGSGFGLSSVGGFGVGFGFVG
jgi:hypothetical protein